jgi:phosphatidylinositol alpha-1,6-mannosyltransferase
VYRPRFPGLVPFFAYALFKGFLLLKENRDIKIVLGGSALVLPVIVILAKLFRAKSAVCVHGLDLIHPNLLYQILCVTWIRQCDSVICNSRFTASLAESKRAREASVQVIPPGVESGWVEIGRKSRDDVALEGKKVILYVGRLVRRKGVVEFLTRSIPSIFAAIPEACFVIIGENPVESMIYRDDIFGEIRKLVLEMRLENRVRLLGGLDDEELLKFYRAADLLVLPVLPIASDVEGFGIVILEAAAAGKPCVATRTGGIPDAVEDGKTGILVEPSNYDAISRAITSLLSDDTLRLTMGTNAQKRTKEQFDWEWIAGKYEALFVGLDS